MPFYGHGSICGHVITIEQVILFVKVSQSLRYVLTWKWAPGKLSPQAVYDYNDLVVQGQIKEAYDVWEKFEEYIKPIAHYALRLPAKEAYAVWGSGAGNGKLDNGVPDGLKLNRCWPQSVLETVPVPTWDDWNNSFPARQAEFRQAYKDIRAMMADIAKSPLLDVLVDDDPLDTKPAEPLLQNLHDRMALMIAYPDNAEAPYSSDQSKWKLSDIDAYYKKGELPPGTGLLFEYYHGYVPASRTEYTDPDNPVFPVAD